ncbi:MAG: PEGA domain-containing protein [Deltaproteobacteria bacterium]|nr:PEGA domain-containing protein [Deltaproteobacteria bacterium]
MGLTNALRLLFVCAAALMICASPALSHAQGAPQGASSASATNDPKAEAMARYQRGIALFDEKDYQGALTELRKAYQLAPTYKLRYKIGQVCYRLQDYACALKAFDAYLSEGKNELSAERKKEVEEEAALVRAQVGRIEITTNTFGAAIAVDDVPVGTTPLEEPILVSIGKRKVTATREGRMPMSQVVEVAGGELKKVFINLPELKAETRTVNVETPSKVTTLTWVGLGATGALAAGAIITGVLAKGASNDLKDMRYTGNTPTPEMEDKQSSVKTLALTSDIFTTAAVLTFGTTMILTFARATPAAVPRKEARGPVVRPGLGLGSLSVSGEF